MKRLSIGFLILGAVLSLLLLKSMFDSRAVEPVAEKKQDHPNELQLPDGAPQLAYLKIETATEDIIPALEPLHGRVTYNDDVTARVTASINGRVVEIPAKLGDSVKAGQPLVVLDSPDFAEARAELIKSESDLNLKRKAHARARLLYQGEVIAEKDYEAAEDDLNQASAEHERAVMRLKNLGGARSRSYELHSPISGIITERHVNTGSEITADTTTPLFVITDPTQLWIDIDVPEKDLNKVALGQRFKLRADAYPDIQFEANAIFIGKILDPVTRRVTVHCALQDNSERLKPEMYVQATPLGGSVLRPRVPNTALLSEGLKTFLFVEKKKGVIEKRIVTLAYRGHDESYVDTGLSAGEHIVVAGALLLNAEMQGG